MDRKEFFEKFVAIAVTEHMNDVIFFQLVNDCFCADRMAIAFSCNAVEYCRHGSVESAMI